MLFSVLNEDIDWFWISLDLHTLQTFLDEEERANTEAHYCKDHSNRILSSSTCLVSDESCVRCKQQRLMKHLGKAQLSWPINICVCTSNLPCDLSRWTSEALACVHSPEVCHTCNKNGASFTVTFHKGSYNLSTSVTRSHFSVRGVETGEKWCCLAPHQEKMWSWSCIR